MHARYLMLWVLCCAAAGASGVVYKAFDLAELRFVAVKVMPVNDKTKRRQMVHELCALYESLGPTADGTYSAPTR